MKKTLSFLIICLGLFFLACDNNNIVSIEIDSTSVLEFVSEIDYSKIKIKVNFSKSEAEVITVTESMFSSTDIALLQASGSHSVTIHYKDKTTIVTITINTLSILDDFNDNMDVLLYLGPQKAVGQTKEVQFQGLSYEKCCTFVMTITFDKTLMSNLQIVKNDVLSGSLEYVINEETITISYVGSQNFNQILDFCTIKFTGTGQLTISEVLAYVINQGTVVQIADSKVGKAAK